MSRLGLRFGVKDRAWDVNSGYYEHSDVLKALGYVRKWKKATLISDNLGMVFRRKALHHIGLCLREAEAVKYPPMSSDLPALVKEAGYNPRIAISARRFEAYALSRMRKEGVDWKTCKDDYIITYETALFNLCLYGGALFCYEDITGDSRNQWLAPLAQMANVNEHDVASALDACALKGRSQARLELADQDCDALYQRMLTCR